MSEALATRVRRGDRRALARAITLVESQLPGDVPSAEELLHALLPHTGGALRLGITGVPGVGKSTFIETLGKMLTAQGHRVAVLAVDPTSSVTGGSILGDKTRMVELARDPNAFIRPSPGGGTLGGVARRTREAMLCCEAAGFDVVLIETIGSGQSDTAVVGMVDLFLLLLLPGAGDDLQGIKRGVMELADVLVVHKADGDDVARADQARQQCELALRLLHSGDDGVPPAFAASSRTGAGLEEVWQTVRTLWEGLRSSDALASKRSGQAGEWLDTAVRELLSERFFADPEIGQKLDELRAQVLDGTLLPLAAARELLALKRP